MRNICREDYQTSQDWFTFYTYMYLFIQQMFTNIYKVNGMHWMHLVKNEKNGPNNKTQAIHKYAMIKRYEN